MKFHPFFNVKIKIKPVKQSHWKRKNANILVVR